MLLNIVIFLRILIAFVINKLISLEMDVQQEVKGMGENTYDPHAPTYSNISMMELNVYLETPTFLNLIGKLTDESILDLGCGEG